MDILSDERGLPPGARGVRLAEFPTVSVVVASCRDPSLLDACLQSLQGQCSSAGAELLVARPMHAAEARALAQRYPAVHFVETEPGSTIPSLRAAGMAAATGDIVALTEDHCVPADDWLEQLILAHGEGRDIVGGAMDNAQQARAVDWAAFFAEYGFFAAGGGAHAEPLLTGANVAYSRRVVEEVTTLASAGEWENVAHARLLARGSTLHFLRTAAVYQNQSYGFWSFLGDRFIHGRDYARRRLVDEAGPRRWLYLLGTLLLPLVLTFRVSRAIGAHHRRPFLRSLPLTFAFLAAWSLGEGWGYACGPAPMETTRA